MIAALTMTGSAWGSLMLACHRRLGGGVIRWLMADEEDRSSGSAAFAALRRAARCPGHKLFVVVASKLMALSWGLQQRRDTFAVVVVSAGMLYTTSTFVTGLTAGITWPHALHNLTNRMRWRVARSAMICKFGLCQELALQSCFSNTLSDRLCRSLEFLHFLLIS